MHKYDNCVQNLWLPFLCVAPAWTSQSRAISLLGSRPGHGKPLVPHAQKSENLPYHLREEWLESCEWMLPHISLHWWSSSGWYLQDGCWRSTHNHCMWCQSQLPPQLYSQTSLQPLKVEWLGTMRDLPGNPEELCPSQSCCLQQTTLKMVVT